MWYLLVLVVFALLSSALWLASRSGEPRSATHTPTRPKLQKVLASAASAFVGLLAGMLWYAACLLLIEHEPPVKIGEDVLVHSCIAGLVVATVWLCILLPAAFRLSPFSELWRPVVCVPLGAAAGFALMLFFSLGLINCAGQMEAAIIGGATCFTASVVLRKYLVHEEEAI
jgi:hypothetical protein